MRPSTLGSFHQQRNGKSEIPMNEADSCHAFAVGTLGVVQTRVVDICWKNLRRFFCSFTRALNVPPPTYPNTLQKSSDCICKNRANPFIRQILAASSNSHTTFRTEIKGAGLQAISSSQFSAPAFGSTNFLDPRKLLRTVLSGF